ncbi:MAG: hypothetical protein LW884_06980 [Bacteroidetes bacterium]|jgi:hypothetical protein|nr:hypothetical protein [Bacteroidota bacterium]
MFDFTQFQVHSPRHSFIRFVPDTPQLILPAEYRALQTIHTVLNAQALYRQANSTTYQLNRYLLLGPSYGMENLARFGVGLPEYIAGYKLQADLVLQQVAIGHLNIYTSVTAFYMEFIPLWPGLRAVGGLILFRTGNDTNNQLRTEPYGEFQYLGLGSSTTLPPSLADFDLFNGTRLTGYTELPVLRSSYFLAEADTAANAEVTETLPPLQFRQGDTLYVPLYLYSATTATYPALVFSLKNAATGVETALNQVDARTIYQVDGARSESRVFSYTGSTATGRYCVYAFSLPAALQPGCYQLQLRLQGVSTGWVSGAFEVVAGTLPYQLLRYRSANDQADFVYQDPANGSELIEAWNQLRLPLQLRNYRSQHERRVYKRSDGISIKLQERVDKLYQLEVDYLPEALHEKLITALSHDYVQLYQPQLQQWIPLVFTGEYEIQWPENQSPLAPAVAEVQVAEYQNLNAG